MIDCSEEWVKQQLSTSDRKLLVAARSGYVGNYERDIIVLDKRKGVLIGFEVKSWPKEILEGTFKSENEWEVLGIGKKPNPLKQAQKGMLDLQNSLPRDLRHNNAKYRWLAGAIFTNLSRVEAESIGFFSDNRLLPPSHPCLFSEEITSTDCAKFLAKQIDNAFKYNNFHCVPMNGRIADRLWKKISPDVTITPVKIREVPKVNSRSDLDPEITAILSKTKTGPHRINGVVGSGKTIFLCHKALELAQENLNPTGSLFNSIDNPPILILTLTVSAASKIKNEIEYLTQGAFKNLAHKWEEQIEVFHFDRFLRYKYGLQGTIESNYNNFLNSIEPQQKYKAVLFDEFQDARPGWGSFIARNLVPHDGLLCITFDPAQTPGFVNLAGCFDEIHHILVPDKAAQWKSRNFYIRKCHRVPKLIGEFAIAVHTKLTRQHFVETQGSGEEMLAKVIDRALQPEFVSSGGKLSSHECHPKNVEEEAYEIAYCIESILNNSDASEGDVIVAIPPGQRVDLVESIADLDTIKPFLLDGQNRDRFYERGEQVTFGTPVRLKGLEAPIVIIAPSLISYLYQPSARKDSFYLAATRAVSELVVMGNGWILEMLNECNASKASQ